MKPYMHKVQYYETDMMGVVHHANYLHWMEEARIDFMDQLGFPYAAMEAENVVSPVTSVKVDYKRSSTFGQEIRIDTEVASFNGVTLTIRYFMTDPAGATVCEAKSEQVFLHRQGGFVRMKREMPAFYEVLMQSVKPEGEDEDR